MVVVLTALLILLPASVARAQGTTGTAPPRQGATDVVEAAGSDGDVPTFRKFNDYQWKRFSLRWGGGFLWDVAGFNQDDVSKSQMNLTNTDGLRDFRVLVKGKLPIPRVTYTVGYMWDKGTESWRFRQTGLMFEIRKAHGSLFVGRTKEGFSTNKIMVGYQGWTIERSPMSDAVIPILGDGIKWTGTIPSGRLVYDVGFFRDTGWQKESFTKNDKQVVFRTVWLPNAGSERPLLHIAFEGRRGLSKEGTLQYRSKPESYLAQSYAVDTGQFAANSATTYGVETYFRPGAFVVGTEYYFNKNDAPQSADPSFHGGEIVAALNLTGETRPYNGRTAVFERVTPTKSLFRGGPGAWELVLRYSYIDLDSGPIRGGKFWRITPMANWHLSGNVRLEFVYGYGSLNRFNTIGKTQFFQSRLQFQL
jgi:phosphate-selective porin OprO/OprP